MQGVELNIFATSGGDWRCELGLAIHIVKVKVRVSDRFRVRVRLIKFMLL